MPGIDTTPAVLRAVAAAYDAKPAYVDGDRSVSFAELLDLVRRTAAGYRARGFRPGERAVIWSPNGIDWVVAALATTYAGGTLVPLNSRYTVRAIPHAHDAHFEVVATTRPGPPGSHPAPRPAAREAHVRHHGGLGAGAGRGINHPWCGSAP